MTTTTGSTTARSHPLDASYWYVNDQDSIADYNNEGNCVAHASFKSGATGGIYTDTDTQGRARFNNAERQRSTTMHLHRTP